MGTPRFDLLMDAARAQSGQSLGNLAVKVNTLYGWDDLVLPPPTLKRVKDVAAAIKYRHIVYSQWGFERRIATGRGLKVLFAGASGTGKTMTAGVIARDLGLDLYKVDLSGIVSKYIGETEKNLERIFRAAHDSNAILFFDEADALFGKRSEVKDAHDRYANIEVAYLLQRMEEHEGAVILASNLSKNIDEAFARRMHYVVEFPQPDEHHREQLWRGMFPPQVPLGKDVDCRFLAKQFPIAGGDIRNVALDAAFLAAQDGQVVTMKQLVTALARQMMKQGRIPSATDFKQFYALLSQ
jgi:SpoVK/Ycf46/Vps4 family AAA+-type ATPase